MNRPKLHLEKGMTAAEYAHQVSTYHAPDDEQKVAHKKVADATAACIAAILEAAPSCADTTHAIRLVREARMWANSAIALRGFV